MRIRGVFPGVLRFALCFLDASSSEHLRHEMRFTHHYRAHRGEYGRILRFPLRKTVLDRGLLQYSYFPYDPDSGGVEGFVLGWAHSR